MTDIERGSLSSIPNSLRERCTINTLPTELLAQIFELGTLLEQAAASGDGEDTQSEAEEAGSDEGAEDVEDPQEHDEEEGWETESDEDDVRPRHKNRFAKLMASLRSTKRLRDTSSPEQDVQHEFPVLVSHVCQRWRNVALNTPALWTNIDFSEGPPFEKSQVYISRSQACPLSIHVNCDPEEDFSDDEDRSSSAPLAALSKQDVQDILALIGPHVHRWRYLNLTVPDYWYMHEALTIFDDLQPASELQVLQLCVSEEETDESDEFTPAELRDVLHLPFRGQAPKLEEVSLWGVHIDWERSHTLLAGLVDFELAWLTMDVRPTFKQFARILRASPALETLTLCNSGPAGMTEADWVRSIKQDAEDLSPEEIFAESIIWLGSVKNVALAFHMAEYITPLMRHLITPNATHLSLDLDDEDHTEFAMQLATPSPAYTEEESSSPQSLLSGLEALKISGLSCNHQSILSMLEQLKNLKTLNLNAEWIDEMWMKALTHPVGTTFETEELRAVLPANPSGMYCPALEHVFLGIMPSEQICEFVEGRVRGGVPLKALSLDEDNTLQPHEEEYLRETLKLDYYTNSDEEDEDDSCVGSDFTMEDEVD